MQRITPIIMQQGCSGFSHLSKTAKTWQNWAKPNLPTVLLRLSSFIQWRNLPCSTLPFIIPYPVISVPLHPVSNCQMRDVVRRLLMLRLLWAWAVCKFYLYCLCLSILLLALQFNVIFVFSYVGNLCFLAREICDCIWHALCAVHILSDTLKGMQLHTESLIY